MHMIQMLGIVTVIFFTTLGLIAFNRDKINTKIGNRIFVIADIIFYAFWMYGAYMRGSSLSIFTLIGNISPLTCVIVAMTPLFSEKIKSMAYSMIAFLNFGLFVALYISPEHAYLFSFYEQAPPNYTGEALCHMICALFGLYLILTRQVKTDFEHWIKAIKFLYPILICGVIYNYIFHGHLFGMDPYGDYSIYMIDIFGSFSATLVAYLVGVLIVLTLGLQVGHLLCKLVAPKEKHEAIGTAESGDSSNEEHVDVASDASDDASTEKTEYEALRNDTDKGFESTEKSEEQN